MTLYLVVLCVATCVARVESQDSAAPCPPPCSCSQHTVDCSRAKGHQLKLTRVPEELPPGTTELNISGNDVADLTPVAYLQDLVTLTADYNSIINVNLETTKLTRLSFCGAQLTAVPARLPKTLITLKLSENRIEQPELQQLVHHMDELQELYLDRNALKTISFSDTSGMNCVMGNLRKLSLSYNQITSLVPDAFSCLDKLGAIELSRNRISVLSMGAFDGLVSLSYLDISHNEITSIEENLFHKLTHLEYLYLHHNLLTAVPSRLPLLYWLDLSHNKISRINETTSKEDLYPIEMINIAKNPLVCDCDILWLKELWDRREFILKYSDIIRPEDFIPKCAEPVHTADESWDMLSDDMFKCDKSNTQANSNANKLQQNERNNDEINALDINLKTLVRTVTKDSVEIAWKNTGSDSATWIFVQYYIFGMRSSTTMFAQVGFTQSKYVIHHLEPNTPYVICVIPKISDELAPAIIDQCVEARTLAKTSEGKPTQVLGIIEYISAIFDVNILISSIIISGVVFVPGLIIYECVICLVQMCAKKHED